MFSTKIQPLPCNFAWSHSRMIMKMKTSVHLGIYLKMNIHDNSYSPHVCVCVSSCCCCFDPETLGNHLSPVGVVLIFSLLKCIKGCNGEDDVAKSLMITSETIFQIVWIFLVLLVCLRVMHLSIDVGFFNWQVISFLLFLCRNNNQNGWIMFFFRLKLSLEM